VSREVTIKVGLIDHDAFKKDVPAAEQEITVRIHELEAEPWGRDAELRRVGHDVPRVDGVLKATGAAKYTYDVHPAGMAYAGLVVSPHAHAQVTSVDASAAKAMKGVLAVKTYEGRRVTYPGTIVAAVCAEDENVLDDALASVRVAYKVLGGPVVTEDAMREGATVVDPRRDSNVARSGGHSDGDAASAIAAAEVVVKAEYRTSIQTHSCLEPHGCTVKPEADGTATVWASTQATSAFAHGRFARALGLKPNQVRTLTQHMGGGFGSKFGALTWDAICAEFAHETGRPVRHLLSRRQEHLVGGMRPDSIQQMELAGTKDGRFLALRGRTWGTAGNATGGAGVANYAVYRFPVVDMIEHGVATFSARGAAFRAPRHPQGFFALESVVERYCMQIRRDPLEIRMRNDPHPIRQVQWRIGAERIGWKKNRRAVPGSDAGPVKRGVGCASGRWGSAGRHLLGRRGPNLSIGMQVDREGGVAVDCCVQDIGTGTRTVMAVLAAEELGLDPQAVEVRIGDSRLRPGPGSGGSTTAPSVGPAVRNAAVRAKESLAALLGLEWGASAKDVAWTGHGFRGPGGKSATWAQACSLIGKNGLQVEGQRRANWRAAYPETAGCQFAQVAVDVETGVIRVEKVVAVHDCGRVVDTLTARSQVNGGVIQGISFALYEEKQLDRTLGDMVNPTLDTYRILGMQDCPEIDVVLTSVVSGYNNVGMMGLGEPTTVPTAGAIANAVANALGVQVRRLPMTPARVLAALAEGQR
jgi:xanthine dehydrogenase YagR molybdenum-binding subunit